jgi:hypothetical protein
MIRRCHGCGSTHVRRSAPRGLEILMALLLIRPYRCLECDCRYYGFIFSKRARPLTESQSPSLK